MTKVWLPWLLVVGILCGDAECFYVLRQVNNPFGYELIRHDEIEAMRANLSYWKAQEFRFYKKYMRSRWCN